MIDFIRSLNYCHFSTVKVDSGNVNFSNLFMYANFISSTYIYILNLKLNPKFASYLNFLQFFIVYPRILNPGPPTGNRKKDLSVFYQNVQGLIPFGSLSNNLDITKIYELQA